MASKPDYIERFFGLACSAAGETGNLTLKVPIQTGAHARARLQDVSNACAFVWNKLTEHQEHEEWVDSYNTI